MKVYSLYLESGPRKQKTMVHVLELLGCIANGPTTEAALAATPGAIRAYLRFLKRHGENVDPAAAFETTVAEHITEGYFLGQGSTAFSYAPDLPPVSPRDTALYIQHLDWSRSELLGLVGGLTAAQLAAEPPQGRAIGAILRHAMESESNYVRQQLGKVEGLSEAVNIERNGLGLLAAMSLARQLEFDRLRAMTPLELAQSVPHGQATWTAHKMFRRMLEHEWEHLLEIQDRLGGQTEEG